MKKMKFIPALVILLIAFSLFSCSTDVEPIDPALINGGTDNGSGGGNGGGNGGGGSTDGVMTATIDGVSFVSEEASGNLIAFPIMGNVLSVTGVKSSGEFIEMQIANPALGTYSASNISADPTTFTNLGYSVSSTSSAIYTSLNPNTFEPTGTITITLFDEVNKKVSGTFSFVGYLEVGSGTKEITNGVFTNISYTLN